MNSNQSGAGSSMGSGEVYTCDYKAGDTGAAGAISLKILVPNAVAGAIIGKGGETIARVQSEAGAKLKMSKSNNFYPGTTERVCLITGPFEAVRKVHNFIMEKIREKPELNPKYEDYRGPFERHQQGLQGSTMMSGCNTPTTSVSNPFMNNSNNNCVFGPVGSCPSAMENFTSTCASSSPFNNSSANINSERFGGSPMLSDSFSTTVNYSLNNALFAGGPSSSGDQMKNQMSFGHNSPMYSPAEDKSGPATKNEIEVAETIVGAILGPGGKGIVELQQLTGTNIQISKKGVYVPGTRNRVVTITGTPNNISKAQVLIQQRLQQEEMKRARQPQVR
ncbi:NOVA [Acanthosepion pharaonis]|uniref:NOVA n=1 Tax=Acanthosepion pharaonis TaxID=158019 RepID=A0A812EK30_ACAPH|nr:NOVA [Sepia pharaonis]